MDQPIRLSVEEFACAMALCGRNEAAMAYLLSTLPGTSADAFNEIMTCASHGLIAQGYLEVAPDLGYGPLRADLRGVAELASGDAVTLRCHKAGSVSGQPTEEFESLTFGPDRVTVHWTEKRVVAVLAALPSHAEAFSYITGFVGATEDNPAAASGAAPSRLPAAAIGALRKAIADGRAVDAEAILKQHRSAPWTNDFLRCLADPAAVWGDILRLDRNADGITAERGLLFVTAAPISWLLAQDPEHEDHLLVIPATGQRLTEILAELTR